MLLVTSYFIVSMYLYIVSQDSIIKSLWFLLLLINVLTNSVSMFEAHLSTKPFEVGKTKLALCAEPGFKFPYSDSDLPFLNVVFVAYLPNEKDIILNSVQHALTKLDYPSTKLRVDLVYNNPHPLPVEIRLQDLHRLHKNFHIHAIPNSLTKAENINHLLRTFDPRGIIALFDADHLPHPLAPRLAASRFCTSRVDCIQGRCIVYNTSASPVAAFCGCDQDRFSTIWQPGRAEAWNFALFTGSNGYWRASVLKELCMSPDAVIEDIDLSLRALAAGAVIVHDAAVISHELAPTTWAAYKTQRVRWAQGYAQLAWQFAGLVFKTEIPLRTRLGIFSLLWLRELNHYFTTQLHLLILSLFLRGLLGARGTLMQCLFHPLTYVFVAAELLLRYCFARIHRTQRSEFVTDRMATTYAVLFPYYAFVISTIGILGHARELCRFGEWKESATARGVPAQRMVEEVERTMMGMVSPVQRA